MINNKSETAGLGNWKFTGIVGQRIDTVCEKRILSEFANTEIYPETEDAFRERKDDTVPNERKGWRGEFWGKYMVSVIAACRYYQSDELREQIRKRVKGLISTQDENGYIGTYADSMDFGRGTWNIWCRKYTLWGLMEAYELLGDQDIVEAAEKFMDHLISEVGPDAAHITDTGQFGGLPSSSILGPVVMLYRASGKKKYLDYALWMIGDWTGDQAELYADLVGMALSGRPIHVWKEEPWEWAKGYEFLSVGEGMLELYRETGNTDLLDAAIRIYESIIEWERSPAGTVTFNDKFMKSKYLINVLSELCDSVYWNRYLFQLYTLTGECHYMDEIERTFCNSLLCGMNINGDWGIRRQRFSHQHIPSHQHFLKFHQCCMDNMPRGLLQYGESVLFTGSDGLYINLFHEGKGSAILDSGNCVDIRIEGDVLADGKLSIAVAPEQEEEFTLFLRIPGWSTENGICVNSLSPETAVSGEYCRIMRNWKQGDVISVCFDMSIHTDFFDPERIPEDDPNLEFHRDHWKNVTYLGKNGMENHCPEGMIAASEDLRDQEDAVIFNYGPRVLSRDIRLDDGDIFDSISRGDTEGEIQITDSDPVKDIQSVYELEFKSGKKMKFCDHVSAGNTWDKRSIFNTWIRVE